MTRDLAGHPGISPAAAAGPTRYAPQRRPEQLGHWLVASGDPFWVSLVSDPRLLEHRAGLRVGPDIALFASH